MFTFLNSSMICSVFLPFNDLLMTWGGFPVYIPPVNHCIQSLTQWDTKLSYHTDTHFTLCPVSLLLQHSVMQCGPGSHVSMPQVVSDNIPAEGTVVVEGPIEHHVARPSETVGQLVGITRLTWA